MRVVYCTSCKRFLQPYPGYSPMCKCTKTLCAVDEKTDQVAVYGPCRVVLISDKDWRKLVDGEIHNVRIKAIKEPHELVRRKDDRFNPIFD